MIIGITGTMSAGKSTVSKIIQETGYDVYNTDKMVHKYYDIDGLLYQDILNIFGGTILNDDQSINRQKLAEIVFNGEDQLEVLEALVFPAVLNEMKEIAKNRDQLIFFEVPLLFEATMHNFFDKIIVVDALKELRFKRALDKGLEKSDITKRMARQWSPTEKREKADYIIDNNFDLKDLQEEVTDILEIITLERSRLWIKT